MSINLSFVKSRMLRPLQTQLTFLLFQQMFFILVYVHAGTHRVPPRVLASGLIPCGGKKLEVNTIFASETLRFWEKKNSPPLFFEFFFLSWGNWLFYGRYESFWSSYNNLLLYLVGHQCFGLVMTDCSTLHLISQRMLRRIFFHFSFLKLKIAVITFFI